MRHVWYDPVPFDEVNWVNDPPEFLHGRFFWGPYAEALKLNPGVWTRPKEVLVASAPGMRSYLSIRYGLEVDFAEDAIDPGYVGMYVRYPLGNGTH